MSQSIEIQLSDTINQLIEINQLGIPLDIYKLKPGLIHFLHRTGGVIIICSIFILALTITAIFVRWNKEPADNYIMFGILAVSTSFSFLIGLAILRFAVPEARNKCVIVCEQGLLQIGAKQVEAVHWSDILFVKKFFHEYFIIYQENKVLELEITYQNIKELIELIKARSGKM